MRIAEIDLTRLQKSYFLGFTNEHLITNVHIKLNNELLEAESFSLMFSVFGSRRTVSNLQAVNGYIDYCLPRDITGIIKRKCQVLFQLTAYDGETVVGKSPVLNGWLDEGLEAEEEVDPTIIPLTDEIHMNTANRHNHTNKGVIDLFSLNAANQLLFNGEPIEAGSVDLTPYAKKNELASVASSGSYNDLIDKPVIPSLPEIPTKTSQLTNDSGFLTEHQSLAAYALKSELPYVPANISAFNNDIGYLTQHQSLAAYALKAELPTVPTNVSDFVNDAGYLTEHQSLAAYALKSELPTVPTKTSQLTNDSGFLTEHQSLAAYALKSELPVVPTKTSQLTNDSGFLTSHQSLAAYATKAELSTVATTGSYNDLLNKPTIPTVPSNVSAFTNDSGYLTEHQSLANYTTQEQINTIVGNFEDFLYNEFVPVGYYLNVIDDSEQYSQKSGWTNHFIGDLFEELRNGSSPAEVTIKGTRLQYISTEYYQHQTGTQETDFEAPVYRFIALDDFNKQYNIELISEEQLEVMDEQEHDFYDSLEIVLDEEYMSIDGCSPIHIYLTELVTDTIKAHSATTATKWNNYSLSVSSTKPTGTAWKTATVYVNTTLKEIRLYTGVNAGTTS